jgi:hypothetical protein
MSSKKDKKIEWAPLNIPFARRLQTFFVALWLALQVLFIIWSLFLLFSGVWTIPMIIYLILMRFDPAPTNGKGRRFEWLRTSRIFHYMRDYFPVNLVKTVRSHSFLLFSHFVPAGRPILIPARIIFLAITLMELLV